MPRSNPAVGFFITEGDLPMWKFFERLAGKVGRACSRAWNWLKGTRPAKFVARCYDRALLATAQPFLWTFYGGPRRSRVFSSTAGVSFVAVTWEIFLAPFTLGYMAWEGLKGLGRVAKVPARWATATVAYAWALVSVAFVFASAGYWWLCNTIGNLEIRAIQNLWGWVTGTNPRRISRYIPLRQYVAHFLAAFAVIVAGVAQMGRRFHGDTHTRRIVQHTTDLVARLHAPTYDWWFDDELPYGTPQDGGSVTGLFIVDVPEEAKFEETISEKEKSENWFLSNGYVLVSANAPSKSDADVFDEYMRERWASLNAADIATDLYGRTWVVPMKSEPLFKDVSTTTLGERTYADQEIAWMTEKDPVARSFSYGRHWAAAIADQDPAFLSDSYLHAKERARLYSKMKVSSLHVEHLLKGFDAWISEHAMKEATV